MLLRYIGPPLFLACALLAQACATPSAHLSDPMGVPLPSRYSQSGDHHALAGEWEYNADGAVVLLRLDERGNGNYKWKGGRFETQMLVGRTWYGMWFQKENNRNGGFTVELSPDLSEGEGRWWYTRIGTDRAPTQKGGTFHVSKRTALYGPEQHSTGTVKKALRRKR